MRSETKVEQGPGVPCAAEATVAVNVQMVLEVVGNAYSVHKEYLLVKVYDV